MSTRFERTNSEYASRSFPSATTDITFGGWFYLHALPSAGSYAPIFGFTTTNFTGVTVGVNDAGRLFIYDANAGVLSTGTTVLSTGTWYYLWFNGMIGFGTHSVFLNGSTTADVSRTGATGSTTINLRFARGGNDFTTYYGDLSLSGWKAWTANRAASNAAAEDDAKDLASTTSAYAEWYFDGTDVTDHHTTANNLTASGTLSDGPSSPVDGATSITGTAAVSPPSPTIVAAGAVAVAGSGAVSPASPSTSAAGVVTVAATGAVSPPSPTIEATGVVEVEGSAAVSPAFPTANGSGTVLVQGTAATSPPVPTIAGAGEVIGTQIEGTGEVSPPLPTASGAGTVLVTGTAAVSPPSPQIAAQAGYPANLAEGAVSPPAPTVSGAASAVVGGSASVSPEGPTASGAAVVRISVSAAVAPGVPGVSAEATVLVRGNAAVIAPAVVVVAQGGQHPAAALAVLVLDLTIARSVDLDAVITRTIDREAVI